MLVVLTTSKNFAQYNLVPNYSFEQYSYCPSAASLYDARNSKPDYWYKPDKRLAGYLNSCAILSSHASVPYNGLEGGYSFQYARTGVAYIILSYLNGSSNNARNYFQVKLTDSLRQGKCYYAECFVNLGDSERYASNNQSMLFTSNAIYADTAAGIAIIPANPQITNYSNPVIKDTQQWAKVSGVFTAQGGEQYLTLGNFRYDNQTTYQQVLVNFNSNGAVYYVDDVSVIPLDSLPLKADAGPDRTIAPTTSTYIGSYTNGLTNTVWYNNAGTAIATNVPGLAVTPAASTFYVLQQTVCGYTSKDTVYVNVGVVPLKIIDYTLRQAQGDKVLNTWITTNETNVSHFNIQRSSNGTNFYTLQKTAAKNNTYNEYSFIDMQPLAGTSYYRLECVDKDGKITYSKTLSIALSIKPLALNIYPNPAKDFITISYPTINQVTITDATGRTLINKQYSNINKVQINILKLPKGMYLVNVIGANKTAVTQKLIVE